MNKDYKPIEIEKAAQVAWDKNASSKVNFSNTKNKYYVLSMFPVSYTHLTLPTNREV